jgi:uncharacterized protein with HEPN domain
LRDDRERLVDILEAIDRAQRYAARGRAAYEGDELVHAYCQADLALVWSVVENDLPSLRKAVADLLDESA